MLIRHFISEAIVNAPIYTADFLKRRIKKLKTSRDTIVDAWAILSAEHDRDAERLFQYLCNAAGVNDSEVEYRIRTIGRSPDQSPLGDLIYSLESYLTHGADFLRYVLTNAQNVEVPSDWQMTAAALPRIADEAIGYGFVTDEDRATPEYQGFAQMYRAYQMAVPAISEFYAIAKEVEAKLGVVHKRTLAARAGQDWRPEHDEVETLYHASAYASEIASEGFHDVHPDDRRGLGLYGKQSGLSMTHSLNIAVQISRCLKEVWMIVHGQLSRNQIMKWAVAEKIDADVRDQLRSAGPSAMADGVIGTLMAYNAYLWFTNVRQNPVFTNIEALADSMKDRSIHDIGVLACEVKLTGGEDYKSAESEFIVQPSQVMSVKRQF